MPRLPEHIAIVMDGCARWAQLRGEALAHGYQTGARAAHQIARLARQSGLRYLTLCCPAAPREASERRAGAAQAEAIERALREGAIELRRLGVFVRGAGETEALPDGLQQALAETAGATATPPGLLVTLTLTDAYGGRRDVALAARQLAALVATGALLPEQIDEELVRQTLSTAHLPDPDFIIRTGGEQRLSDVFIYESAYAELYFSDALWPDFDAGEWQRALLDYGRRERRFGKTSEQIQGSGASGLRPAAMESAL